MDPFTANVVSLSILMLLVYFLAFSLLWRVGSWSVPRVQTLVEDEGLPLGSKAMEVACLAQDEARHISFGGLPAFLVFGKKGCEPCGELLDVARRHPVTRDLRLIYIHDGEDYSFDLTTKSSWEIYRFHDEERARESWRAPVSPYFHLIGEQGTVLAKGVANRMEHLDRLFELSPPQITAPHVRGTFGDGT